MELSKILNLNEVENFTDQLVVDKGKKVWQKNIRVKKGGPHPCNTVVVLEKKRVCVSSDGESSWSSSEPSGRIRYLKGSSSDESGLNRYGSMVPETDLGHSLSGPTNHNSFKLATGVVPDKLLGNELVGFDTEFEQGQCQFHNGTGMNLFI
ncbi:hypothetical protein QYF36_021441 [Acer negundo]|nr:hypothetical protein QYF36_021441 [Acer negundo]